MRVWSDLANLLNLASLYFVGEELLLVSERDRFFRSTETSMCSVPSPTYCKTLKELLTDIVDGVVDVDSAGLVLERGGDLNSLDFERPGDFRAGFELTVLDLDLLPVV